MIYRREALGGNMGNSIQSPAGGTRSMHSGNLLLTNSASSKFGEPVMRTRSM